MGAVTMKSGTGNSAKAAPTEENALLSFEMVMMLV
jgi:hypothetical protein